MDRTGVLLDIGGGTGAHAAQWAGDAVMPIVVDPSASMCRQAALQRGVGVVTATSQHLPFRDAITDLVYFHLSIHYGSYVRAIDEALRVSKPGSMIEIWTFSPESMATSALARWFPRIGELDAERFPPIEAIVARLDQSDADVSVTECPETVERTAGSWETAVRHRFVSTIQLLSTAEIDDGLRRFGAEFNGPHDIYRYTIQFVRIRATRQPLASAQ
jgi:ubiquinone/menaquinone biosynthesis C-methylase UbiE